VRCGHLVARRRSSFDELDPVTGVRPGELLDRRNPGHAVARYDGEEHDAVGASRKQLRDSRQHGVVAAEEAVKERSPREVHRQRLRQTAERLRRMLGCRYEEERVRQAPGCTPGRSGHGSRVRIDAENEGVGTLCCRSQYDAAVTRAEVERHFGVTFRQASEVRRFELVDGAATNDAEHAERVTEAGRPLSGSSRARSTARRKAR
jgi:hypothetical protein